MRGLCIAVLLMLAGCAGQSAGDPAQENVDEVPRGAIIEVSVDGSIRDPVNGTVGVASGVNVTFNGTRSVGAEGTYAWDFGDGSTADGAVVQHSFAPGPFDVTLTIGANGTASQVLRIAAKAPEPPAGVLLETQPFTFEGNLPLGNPNTATTEGTDYRDHVVTITETTENGTASVADSVHITLTSSGGALETYLYWISPNGENLATASGGADQVLQHDAQMPAGDYIVRVRVFIGVDVDYTIEGEIDHVTP